MIDTSIINLVAFVCGVLFTVVTGGWVIYNTLAKKIENGDEIIEGKLDRRINQTSNDLHLRANRIESNFTPRVEHEKDITKIHTDIGHLKQLIVQSNALIEGQNSRIDQVLLHLGSKPANL